MVVFFAEDHAPELLRPDETTAHAAARIGHSSTRAAMIYQHASRDGDHTIAAALDALIVEARKQAST